jgi:CRISPR-associated protein Cmr3
LAGLKPAESAWLTSTGLASVLNGQLPAASEIFFPGDLWETESRVGLKRDPGTKQVGEGDLYSPGFIRLARHVTLGVGIDGVPAERNGPEALFPFGGESRLAQCDELPAPFSPAPPAPPRDSFKVSPALDGKIAFTISLLTPGSSLSGDANSPLAVPKFPDATVTIVSACVGKPVFFGGWDSLNNRPLPLTPFHPAGSVWFCKADPAAFDHIYARHAHHHGHAVVHGHGQILIGHWPNNL